MPALQVQLNPPHLNAAPHKLIFKISFFVCTGLLVTWVKFLKKLLRKHLPALSFSDKRSPGGLGLGNAPISELDKDPSSLPQISGADGWGIAQDSSCSGMCLRAKSTWQRAQSSLPSDSKGPGLLVKEGMPSHLCTLVPPFVKGCEFCPGDSGGHN